jgi:thymidylate synthase ThyX
MNKIESYEIINKIGVASILNEDTNIKVTTLVPNPEIQFASISSYLGARYSRSSSDVKSILKGIEEKQIDSDKRLGTILSYGHASVADMAEVPIYIENVPMYMAFKLFYMIPTLAGQERSTRYQDFTKLNVYFDDTTKDTIEVKGVYLEYVKECLARVDRVYNKSVETFTNLYRPSNKEQVTAIQARSFDVARNFIPLGVNTSLMITTSVRNWANCLTKLLSSSEELNIELGVLIFQLLKGTPTLKELGYLPQAPELVKYVSTNTKSLEEVIIEHKDTSLLDLVAPTPKPISLRMLAHTTPTSTLLRRMNMLGYQLERKSLLNDCFPGINRHNQAGNILQEGAYTFSGQLDLGSLRDINRHRSLERFIPYLHDDYNTTCIPDITFCPFRYTQNPELEQFYNKAVAENLNSFEILRDKITNEYSKGLTRNSNLLVKLSYVLGMQVHYEIGGSIDDWQYFCDLRRRPGGHIEYRIYAQLIADKLVEHDLWLHMLFNDQSKVDALSKEQFYDRS